MSAVCRACVKMQQRCFNIFDHYRNDKLISDLLTEHTTVEVQKDDGLPIYMCYDCLDRLNSAYDFKAMVIESDIKLRSILSNIERKKNLLSNVTSNVVLIVKPETPVIKVEKCDILTCGNEKTKSVMNDNELLVDPDSQSSMESNLVESKSHEEDFSNKEYTHQVEKCDILTHSSDKITSVMDDNNFTQSSLVESNKREDDNECNNSFSNKEYTQAVEIEIDSEKEIEEGTSLSTVNVINDSITINQYNRSIQENEMLFINDNSDTSLLTYNSSNSVRKDIKEVNLVTNEEGNQPVVCDAKQLAALIQNKKPSLIRSTVPRKAIFCQPCNKIFSFYYYFAVHVGYHTGDMPFKCDICGKGFAKQFILNAHKISHSDNRPHMCDVCGKGFKSLTALQRHMLTHSEQKSYTCNECNKSFKTETILKTHLLTHEDDKKFVCEICGKGFVIRTSLNIHMLTHKTEKNVPCLTCGKCFSTKSRMKTHLKRHSDERPFSCSYCDKRFGDKQVLNNHTLIHKGEKPYTCKICSKPFRQSCGLRLHLRSHTGETPYSCKLCQREFRYLYRLQNHMKAHSESQEK